MCLREPILRPGGDAKVLDLDRQRELRAEVVVEAPLERIPVWVRSGSIVVTYPPEHVAGGLGDTPESERPLVATLWGRPPLGHTGVRLADGTRISWRRGKWAVPPGREIELREIGP
jgi:hypothetical protein